MGAPSARQASLGFEIPGVARLATFLQILSEGAAVLFLCKDWELQFLPPYGYWSLFVFAVVLLLHQLLLLYFGRLYAV